MSTLYYYLCSMSEREYTDKEKELTPEDVMKMMVLDRRTKRKMKKKVKLKVKKL